MLKNTSAANRRFVYVISTLIALLGSLLSGIAPSKADVAKSCDKYVNNICILRFTDTTQVLSWVAPLGINQVHVRLVGGTGGDDLRGNEPNLAHSLDFNLLFSDGATDKERTLQIGVGEGGASGTHACPADYSLPEAKNPFGKFYGGPGRAWCYPSAGASGAAATALIAQSVTYVAAGTGGGSSNRGPSWWDFDISARDWQVGDCQHDSTSGYCFVQGGGGGLIGGSGGGWAAGASGQSGSVPAVDGLVMGSQPSSPGQNGYAEVTFQAAASPNNVTVHGHSTSLHVSWDAVTPADQNAIITYTASAGSDSLSCTTTGTSCDIYGLTNGQTYSVTVTASDGTYTSLPSVAVSGMPVAPPSAPAITSVIANNGQATLSISAPTQINDSALSGYDYSTNNGSTWSHFASVTGPFTITGLTSAPSYQVKVRAVNSAGVGDASAAVTVNLTRLIPAKPVIASVVGGNNSATVNITTPTDVTAQSITGYQYSIDKGATYQSAVLSNGSFTITGLTNGVSTSVQIRATNFNGNSLASVAKTVVPATTPAAPSITTITPSVGALSIAFTAPNTGGSAITSYQYSLDGGSTWVVPKTAIKTSPIKVTGLPNATSYQVKIRAANAKGTGLASDVVSASTPVLVPSAPVTTSIAKTSTTFTVDVTAPTNNGGGAITNYAYSVDNGKTWTVVSPASNSTRIVITGLTPNTIYPVQIAAINSAGRGAASAKYNVGTLR